MPFLLTYMLFGISLISWQLWNKSFVSNILGKSTWVLLILSFFNISFYAFSGKLNLIGLSISLVVLGISSAFAMFLNKRQKTKFVYLLSTSLLHFLIVSSIGSPSSSSITDSGVNEIPEFIVKVNPLEIDNFIDFAESRKEIKIVNRFTPKDYDKTDIDDYFVVDILGSSPKKIRNEIAIHPSVEYIENNEEVFTPAFASPARTTISSSYIFQDPMNKDQWALDNTNMNAFYEIAKDQKAKKKIKLFILDTGVDAGHEDLKDVYKSSGKKNDRDVKGHGTHCAGVAAAVTGNDLGISSFNFDQRIEIYSEKVLADFGGGTQAGIIKGMLNAVDKGADVISMSLGGMSSDKKQRAYDTAVKYATDNNCIVVVAAGNSSSNAKKYSPANSRGVITVAASDINNELASFSNTIDDIEMGVFAPGVDILSTFPNNRYESFSGTSMATPFVAGLISLLKSIKPSLDTREAYEILNASMNASSNGIPIVDPKTALEKLISNESN